MGRDGCAEVDGREQRLGHELPRRLDWVPACAGTQRGEREAGFTLLEMLVALAVFSLAALALVRLQGVTLRTAADLDSKAMGQIVARNLMVDMQTDPAPPSLGTQEGEMDNGGRRWRWNREVKAMADKRLLQVDLVVDGQVGSSPVVLSFVRVVQ